MDVHAKNIKAYEAIRHQLEVNHMGRTALLHEGNLDNIYDTNRDAYSIGCEKYGLGHFTLMTIGERPIDLGIHTLCVPEGESA